MVAKNILIVTEQEMLKSPYKIKYWSPVKKVPKAYDPYWNVIEWEEIESGEQQCSSDFFYFFIFLF